MNIEGKRSGEGFVAHKAILVNALSRALAERVTLCEFSIGRKGFLTYLKSLGGSNIVKIVPASGNASGLRVTDKRLKVVCGTNTSYLEDMAWIGDNTAPTLCDIRVSPSNTIIPNLGSLELSEALSRVLPFNAREETRPVLQCVLFKACEGKLTMVSADGFRLSVVKLDYDGDEGQALIHHDELKGVVNALRKAYRVRLSFGKDGDIASLMLDTELIRYKWLSSDGTFPDYSKLIPSEFNTFVSFDSNEATRAVNSLKVLSDSKAYPVDLAIGSGKLILSSPDDKGQAEIPADTLGEGRIRLDGAYLSEAVKACGGMVDLKLVDSKSPMLFSATDYQLVVMPMITGDNPPRAEAKPAEVSESEIAEAVAEAEAITKAKTEKPKRKHKAKEPVAV